MRGSNVGLLLGFKRRFAPPILGRYLPGTEWLLKSACCFSIGELALLRIGGKEAIAICFARMDRAALALHPLAECERAEWSVDPATQTVSVERMYWVQHQGAD